MQEDTINKKFAEQAEILQKLVIQSEKNQRTLNWIRALGVIKVVAILIPIILGTIYLPSFFKNMATKYQDILPNFEQLR